jgi:pyruvate/2-oxoglutarate dehydrogenase complex dihydrolipoamide dehydrogenase (E3) component
MIDANKTAMSYDAIVIGSGQGGKPLARELGGAGRKTAIIEMGPVGGTCINVGCTPTKTMVASARAAHVARRAVEFGVLIDGPVNVDMRRVKLRKDEIVRHSNEGVERWLKGTKNLTVYEGHARFEAPHLIRVGDDLLEADRIFINVGARAVLPEMPGAGDVDVLTSSDMMDIDFVPEHLVVIGGSYIGLEFGQMFRRFGSKVTVVEMQPRLIAREDEDVSLAIQEILESEGVELRLNAECVALARDGAGARVTVACDGGEPEVRGSHLLMAVGRRPNTDDLGLEKAGIEVDARGFIQVDDRLRTSVPNVWALGDVNGRGAFTHTSYNDHEIVADNLLNNDTRRVTDRIQTYGLFIDPPLGRVGVTEAQARESGREVLVGKRPMTRVSRAVEKGETHGFIKIMVDANTKEILGAAILGVGGDEAVHSILDVMYAKAPYTVITRAVHIHPTVSELIPTTLGDLKPLAVSPRPIASS